MVAIATGWLVSGQLIDEPLVDGLLVSLPLVSGLLVSLPLVGGLLVGPVGLTGRLLVTFLSNFRCPLGGVSMREREVDAVVPILAELKALGEAF